jgi:hypothetical protein
MLWKEIKTWAKNKGYETIKDKKDGQYYWAKFDSSDPMSSGVASSVSKLATAIYNHMTDDKWLDHQKEYRDNLELKKVEVSEY